MRKIPEFSSDLLSSTLLKMNTRIIDSESPDDRLNASRMLVKIESGYDANINKSYLKNKIDALNVKSVSSGSGVIPPPIRAWQ